MAADEQETQAEQGLKHNLEQRSVADAAGNWVDAYAPRWARGYLRLARADRPIGTWLLLWPCWWSIALAAPEIEQAVRLGFQFALGAIVMRGAGCTFNDLMDRDLDGLVERTAQRPLPSGQVSVGGAWVFLMIQLLVGLAVLLTLHPFAIAVGAASIVPVAIYPFMKRITWWPQLFLGIAFNWGALLGWAAVRGELSPAALWLYLGGIFWTLGYDTIYAHQDKEDDALIGVKSSARRLGEATKPWLIGFYAAATACFALAFGAAQVGLIGWLILPAVIGHFIWQILRVEIDDPAVCLIVFRSNRELGLILFVAIAAGIFLA